ncbi:MULTISPECIES: AbrB/MazE/SpoVT family DNA-binding domain-containing protein [Bacillus]|uniref:AbrB/MazE/SpoVT family DNA-binding domain-containing protein n=1 Tax=Bacillus glycinifermentans TaxID=1664069 RepID=A0A0T6BN42_9BACI|nr:MULTISPECIES: AbrB/MazE/SpoVT family DNA-binding domain-containing protein [Bacillus]KRT93071.1 hypothetical protein AB447_203825 [Bacillus glycinifermentans]MEC0341948.1 AbrB/MazE/SpoVT family DNA-binding domain-containing protein [Bacillus sonorensis]MEC0457367.1 AbrB/MazE/SpoVT family DNA-binding domain-containing protein [Bacillus sonorensis]MEC0487882.1 AbrB/MazE/SpoVT family DNA-binding domain-containing protein [Bacillus glycinifermentans]MEC0530667.1 AbrB/MazE/SpoVT family DNA-bindi
MRSTGIVRKVDELGRIVVPKELRRTMNINEKDSIEIFVEGENIILRKFKHSGCMVTGEVSDHNMILSGGIELSHEGAQIIVKEILNNLKANT